MQTQKPTKTPDNHEEIRIRLDAKNIIRCKRGAIKYWTDQYPNAKVIKKDEPDGKSTSRDVA